MLDAARALVLSGGAAAASARGVSLATGAPSGSVYHRFPGRDDLVAAAWLRAQDRFLDSFLGALVHGDAADAGVTVLTWCTDHPEDGALLLRHSLADLVRGDVSPGITARADLNNARVASSLAAVAEARGVPVAQVLLALVDLPLALTRRVLRDNGRPSVADEQLLRRAVCQLLA
jgi:AcrR family transcriptional regulator